jgi:hypothetical protein
MIPFPCGSDLDEDALTTDSLFLIKLDQTLCFPNRTLHVEREAGVGASLLADGGYSA